MKRHYQLIKLPNTVLILFSRLYGAISILNIKKYNLIDGFSPNAGLMDVQGVTAKETAQGVSVT
jgi:hypothetical protein